MQLFANNIETTLSGSLTTTATSATVTSATGMPAPTGGDFFLLTLCKRSNNVESSFEIVKVTAVSGTTLTIVRAQEGTSGTAYVAGDIASLRLTAGTLNNSTMNADTNVSSNGWVLDEDDMASDSATKVPTQQSVKAYVDEKQTLLAINKIISGVNCVAICYHNVKDDDDPNWIEKCADTSWYNEQLKTSTRGKTRKFPAECLIVAESDTVTIYDLTDPSVPMWMVITPIYGGITSVHFCNGECSFSLSRSTSSSLMEGLWVISFPLDNSFHWCTTGSSRLGSIEGVKANILPVTNVYLGEGLVHNSCNDLAITLLPNAPINPATSMRYPTIAVYTDNGLSVIDSVVGTVIDLGTGTKYVSGSVEGERVFAVDDVGTVDVWDIIPIINTVAPDTTYSATSIPALLGDVVVTV